MSLSNNRRGKEEAPNFLSGLTKLRRILSFFVVFVAGIIVGLAVSARRGLYTTTRSELVFPDNIVPSMVSAVDDSENCTIPPPCEEVDCLNTSFISPNRGNLTHGMTDQELFWRASLWPNMKKYPFKRVPKVAFMFLTRGPLPMMPLWERFFQGQEKYYSIYIHTPPSYKLNVSHGSPFYGRKIPSKIVRWGDISLLDAEKRLLANALLDFSNERFVLLSESCIPVYDLKTVYKYLINSNQGFVESYDEPTRFARGRYNKNMHPDIKLYQWRKGSQWFEMQRELAVHMIGDVKYYNIFRRHCKPACYPDEHYTPTFFNMFYRHLNSNRTVTWVDWSMQGPHPATYRAENVTKTLIQSIRNSATECMYNSESTSVCYLFARKFDPSVLKPLLNLTSTVMGF